MKLADMTDDDYDAVFDHYPDWVRAIRPYWLLAHHPEFLNEEIPPEIEELIIDNRKKQKEKQ